MRKAGVAEVQACRALPHRGVRRFFAQDRNGPQVR